MSFLWRKTIDELKQGKADISEKRSVAHERDGKLRNLLKKTYLNRWVGPLSLTANVVDPHLNDERNFSGRRSSSTDYARSVKILESPLLMNDWWWQIYFFTFIDMSVESALVLIYLFFSIFFVIIIVLFFLLLLLLLSL